MAEYAKKWISIAPAGAPLFAAGIVAACLKLHIPRWRRPFISDNELMERALCADRLYNMANSLYRSVASGTKHRESGAAAVFQARNTRSEIHALIIRRNRRGMK